MKIIVLCMFLLSSSIVAQPDTVNSCGLIIGHPGTNCLHFQPNSSSTIYLLSDYLGYTAGDSVHVVGVADSYPFTFCDTVESYLLTISELQMCDCCMGTTGNVDGDSASLCDIGDLTDLIDYLFISHTALDCPGQANTDGDIDVVIDIGDVTKMISYLFVGDTSLALCPSNHPGDGELVSKSSCKSNKAIISQTCVLYEFRSDSLFLTHSNAAFNCCPSRSLNVTIVSDTVRIEEVEIVGRCECLCLFDLDFVIAPISAGTYVIEIIEEYTQPTDSLLIKTVDLSASPNGSFCVTRSHYPW